MRSLHLSPTIFVIGAWHFAKNAWPLAVIAMFGQERYGSTVALLIVVGVSLAALGGLASLIVEWRRSIVSFDSGRLEYVSVRRLGFSTSRFLAPVDRVTSVDVRRDAVHRATGTAALRVSLSGDDKSGFEIPALRMEDAGELRNRLTLGTDADARSVDVEEGDLLYAASTFDLALASLTYARFVFVATGIVSFALELSDVGLGSVVDGGIRRLGPVAIGVGLICLGLLGGFGSMLFSYGRLRVSESRGVLTIERGVITSVRQHLAADNIIGLRLEASFVERLLGRRRILAISRGVRGNISRNLVVPSAKAETVDLIADRLMGLPLSAPRADPGQRALIAARIVAVVCLGAVALAVGLHVLTEISRILVVLLIGAVVVAAAEGQVRALSISRQSVLARKGVLWTSLTFLKPVAVGSIRWRESPISRRLGRATVRAWYVSAGLRCVTGFGTPLADARSLCDVACATAEPR